MTVDSFLNGDFMDESDDEDLDAGASPYSFYSSLHIYSFLNFQIPSEQEEEDELGDGDSEDDGSFASIDDLDDGQSLTTSHKQNLCNFLRGR